MHLNKPVISSIIYLKIVPPISITLHNALYCSRGTTKEEINFHTVFTVLKICITETVLAQPNQAHERFTAFEKGIKITIHK